MGIKLKFLENSVTNFDSTNRPANIPPIKIANPRMKVFKAEKWITSSFSDILYTKLKDDNVYAEKQIPAKIETRNVAIICN